MHDGKHVPSQSVGSKLMCEKASNVPELIGFVAMDGFIVRSKRRLEKIGPESVQFGKPLPNETVEFAIGPLLGTALYHHGAKLILEALRQSNLCQM